MANINKIRLSGTTYNIEDENAAKSVTLTQAEYDALVSGGTVDPNTFYIISDSSIVYMTSADTESAITQAVSGKQDTLVSGVNIKTVNNQSLLGSGNVDVQGGSITVDTALDSGSTNPVENRVIYNKIDEVEQVTAAGLNALNESLNGKANTTAFTAHTADTTVHTTSAEKTSWDGAATNASNAITALGGLKLVKLTQAQYDALATKDSNTLYVIVN